MFDRLSNAFSSLVQRLAGQKKLNESLVNELLTKVDDALVDADVPYEVTKQFINTLRTDIVGMRLNASLKPEEQIMKVVHDTVLRFLGDKNQEQFVPLSPSTIMVMGLQGSGKTTTLVKLAHYLKQEARSKGKERKILLASLDFYRPAAIDQLEIGAQKVQAAFYRATAQGVEQAALEITHYAKSHGYEHLLLDTAGRLHLDERMLDELQKIVNSVQPRYKFMVLDGMMGQQSLAVAKTFNQSVGFDAASLTKMDSDTRGGVAFAFRYAIQKPIFFMGTGEKVEDFELYKSDRIAGRMLGMGDLLTLAEQAEKKIKEDERKKAQEAFTKGVFTLRDFASQLDMMNNLGSLSHLAQYMPGMGGMRLDSATISKGEIMIKKYRAIINSMTPKERLTPKILNGSRKQRIARGAGVTIQDIGDLLNRFEQTQQFVKLMKMGGISRFFKH